jgi:hypothetical protein
MPQGRTVRPADRQFRTDQRAQAGGFGGLIKPRQSVDAVAIEQRQRGIAQRCRSLDERCTRAGTLSD